MTTKKLTYLLTLIAVVLLIVTCWAFFTAGYQKGSVDQSAKCQLSLDSLANAYSVEAFVDHSELKEE
ncbi:MAG: hypothetical protein EOP49_18985 [Sphingobacteriales bacterium]|nr:MAG: hypothetical protein EOP49_18985 [Sphingobacteriales bacterium]